jgi:hypothetical protein
MMVELFAQALIIAETQSQRRALDPFDATAAVTIYQVLRVAELLSSSFTHTRYFYHGVIVWQEWL